MPYEKRKSQRMTQTKEKCFYTLEYQMGKVVFVICGEEASDSEASGHPFNQPKLRTL